MAPPDWLRRLSVWAAERGREPSTWCGLTTGIPYVAHHHNAADLLQAAAVIGPVLCASYLVVMKESS